MDVHDQRLVLSLRYPVMFTRWAFHPANACLRDQLQAPGGQRARVWMVVDGGVLQAWPGLRDAWDAYVQTHARHLENLAPLLELPGGEAAKNDPSVVTAIQRGMHELGMDRHAYLIAVGGGAVLDVAGYAAALVHRGVRLVRMPTTTLAQGDAGVGVKNGVNAFGKKNFLGTFAAPWAVINDLAFLDTLAPRERRAGLAEAVKVAVLKDPGFFARLVDTAEELRAGTPKALEAATRRAAVLHLEHIAGAEDPFEQGSARPLDFGHWAAHKLEALSLYRLRHGEAVAIGMALDTLYAARVGICAPQLASRVHGLLRNLGFSLWDRCLDERDSRGRRLVMLGLDEFREHLGGRLCITLPTEIGGSVEVDAVRTDVVEDAIDVLRSQERVR